LAGASGELRSAGHQDKGSVRPGVVHTIEMSLGGTASGGRVETLIQSRIAKATAKKASKKEVRKAKRVTSRRLASLWRDGMSAPLSCTILDRSSTGAQIEVLTDRFNDRLNEIAVGDRFTLTQSFAQERTSVTCEIVWMNDRRCGVSYCGQIRTEILKSPKKAQPKPEEKPAMGKSIKSLFSSGAR
jgi:hypothetical protein